MSEIVIYEDGDVAIRTTLENESIWLRQSDIAMIFAKDRTVITRHINNILRDKEVDEKSNVQKMHIANSDKPVKFYSLDIVLAVGYRTNSAKAIKFRRWATKVLKEYLLKGYAIDQKRLQAQKLQELNETLRMIRLAVENRELSANEARGFVEIISHYAKSWALLQGYDEQSLTEIKGHKEGRFILDYDEAKRAIAQLKATLMAKGEATELFGNEKAGEFKGNLLNIYQSFGGEDLLPSLEAKAANLLYYVVKGHPFNDGNKRIGAYLFVLFLHKNDMLHDAKGEAVINDNTLVSLTLLVAQSDPGHKEIIIKLIMNMLYGESL
ncbi:RhuM family protein [Nitratifractor salsuginis]|uniref:Filamentation induced by cAMP protein Fic n=1 Tax=Nitratifractor salsuginis (strain DSM 16511 / JCM 12458 / E9I37-1) TaxID=749222 RepID=E6X288_NITSE|nr:RhuM family protein [Nitratifractor salsuginis]ADV46023.1 filamentation induced by cAMP protein Fic [Nitratifractor salsuginis DSM 16511]